MTQPTSDTHKNAALEVSGLGFGCGPWPGRLSFLSGNGVSMAKKRAKKAAGKKNGNGATLGFEQTLWAAADKLRTLNVQIE